MNYETGFSFETAQLIFKFIFNHAIVRKKEIPIFNNKVKEVNVTFKTNTFQQILREKNLQVLPGPFALICILGWLRMFVFKVEAIDATLLLLVNTQTPFSRPNFINMKIQNRFYFSK